MPPQHFWKALETIPGLSAVPSVWQKHLGEHFLTFRRHCLQPSSDLLTHFPCPADCGCSHFIIHRHDRAGAIAVCCCNPPRCPDIPLAVEQITPLELAWPRLALAICTPLHCAFKLAILTPLRTLQIGSWSAAAIPVILTLQCEPGAFRSATAELAAQLRQPFILLAPTSNFIDAPSQAILQNHGAAFFSLEAILRSAPDGTWQPTTPPDHLFSRFDSNLNPNLNLNLPPCSNAGPTPHSALPLPHSEHALRKGLGVWSLTFDGKHAQLKHQRGIFFVAYLLANPPQDPIHALDLAAKIPEIYRHQLGLMPIPDPITGKPSPLPAHARIQERSLALDDVQALRALTRKERELEAILDDDDQSEPVKAEALRELEDIAAFLKQHSGRTATNAQRAVRAVRRAITRFHQSLTTTLDRNGSSHPVLHPFAAHLNQYLLIPSARYSGPFATRTRAHLAGCFIYLPPPGVVWLS